MIAVLVFDSAECDYIERVIPVEVESTEVLYTELCERLEKAKALCIKNQNPYLFIEVCGVTLPMYVVNKIDFFRVSNCPFNPKFKWLTPLYLHCMIYSLDEWIFDYKTEL